MSPPPSHRPPSRCQPLTADALWALDRVGAVALAPDGGRAVCAVTSHSMERNEAQTRLWLLPTERAAPRRLTHCGSKDGQPAWSPRGDRIAFVARRGQEGCKDATPQIYLIDPDGGEARRASDFAPGIESFKWLPDGRRIVFASWVWPELRGAAAQARRHREWQARKESGYATSAAYYRHWDRNLPQDRVLHLWLLDLEGGTPRDLFEGSTCELPRDAAGSEVYDPHPDGRRIAFAHDPAVQPLDGNRQALAEVVLHNGRIAPLLDDPAWDFSAPRYSPDGRRLALIAAHVGRVHTAPSQPAVVEADGAWRVLAPDWDRSIDAPLRWSADGRCLTFMAEDRGRRHLWRCAVDTGQPPDVAHAGGWVQAYDQAGDRLVVAADSALHPARVLAHRTGAPPSRLDDFNDAALERLALGEVREEGIRGALGDEIQYWLTLPPAFDAKRRHPLIHVIHGGPHAAAGDSFSYRWNPHVFAAGGAVIAQVNYHGSSGFGHAFRHSLIGRQGELELQDIEAATDALLARRWIDAQRVCATGGSYGGFLVAWMNGHVAPGRYRAYVCHAGVFDRIATFSADSYPSRPKDLAARYWEDMPRVLAQSPHASAAAMDTPTLVIHGAQDFRVPDCNGLAYYNTLKARGVEARLLWFPDEHHWVLKPRNSRLWYAEFMAWIEAHTKSPARRADTPRRGRAGTIVAV